MSIGHRVGQGHRPDCSSVLQEQGQGQPVKDIQRSFCLLQRSSEVIYVREHQAV